MNGESLDREVILACVIELMEIIDEDGNGEITRDEFIQNGMKSGFIRNLMEFFNEDDPKDQSKQSSAKKKVEDKPNEKDHQESEVDCDQQAWILNAIYILECCFNSCTPEHQGLSSVVGASHHAHCYI